MTSRTIAIASSLLYWGTQDSSPTASTSLRQKLGALLEPLEYVYALCGCPCTALPGHIHHPELASRTNAGRTELLGH